MINAYEKLLTTYAYNILGSYEDAKDVVQDAYLNFIQLDNTAIENKKAYLVRSVINLSINKKNKQKRERAIYPGEWLPEPIATEKADTALNLKEILSYSIMVLLEKLNAKQRAVFILKEAFAYDHAEIAAVLDISEEHSRKLLSRAKEQLKTTVDAGVVSKERLAYADKYLSVIHQADMQQLEKMLHDDVKVISDGGGKAIAFRKPVIGRNAVIKLLLGVHQKYYAHVDRKKVIINHEPALCYYENGKLVTCQIFSLEQGHLRSVYFLRNPDKLRSLEKNLSETVTF
jgi:RNA polymerase sigma-70 factor (ECF subfamily)